MVAKIKVMKVETAKEKVIREAYGENWHLVKDKVNKDGWIKDREFIFSDFIKGTDWQTTDHDDEWYDTRRPSQLKGIENNNGWIRIEENINIPSGYYWILYSNSKIPKMGVSNGTSLMQANLGLGLYPAIPITHYQPIQKPEPPIY